MFADQQDVHLWRFEDPRLGDRKLPIFQEPTKGKVLISPDSTFKVNINEKKVLVTSNSKQFEIGSSIIYLLN